MTERWKMGLLDNKKMVNEIVVRIVEGLFL